MTDPRLPGGPGRGVTRAAIALAPVLAALGAVLSLAIPPAAFVLLPGAAARLVRAAGDPPAPLVAFGTAAAAVPVAALLGLLAVPAGGPLVAPIAVLVFVSIPALGLVAARAFGRTRAEASILCGALTGIGLLSIHLGLALADGRDPGVTVAEKLAALAPSLLDVYRKAGWTEASIGMAADALVSMQQVLATHLTGLLLAVAALYGVLLVYPFGRLAGLTAGSFADYRLPVGFTAAFVPAGALAALASGSLARVGVDVLIGLSVLFFTRGLAIIRALLDRGRFGLLIRVPVYLLALQMPIPLLVALGGLLDEFVDIRLRMDRKGGGEDQDGAG